jgi:hypothetical protein
MKTFITSVLILCTAISVQAAGLEDMLRSLGGTQKSSPASSDEGSTAAGLKEALDGLFLVVGQEEKKIRTDPAARTTDLLRTVFGGK